MQAVIPGINTGNTRERRIRSFLVNVPKRATRLVLVAPSDEDGPTPLAEWSADEVHEELEPLITQALDEYASDEDAGNETRVTLAFVDEAGEPVKVLRLQARKRDVLASAAALGAGIRPGTNAATALQQSQAQQLNMHKLEIAAIVTTMQQGERLLERSDRMNERMFEMVDRMADRLGIAETRVVERDAELDEMAHRVREAQSAVQAAPPQSDARARAESMFKQLLTPEVIATVVAKLLGAGPSAPPRLPQEPPPAPPEDAERVD